MREANRLEARRKRMCQMLSRRSLAFILASAIRRARAFSSAAFAPNRNNGRKIARKIARMLAKMATNTDASMSVSYE